MPTHRIALRGPWEYRWHGRVAEELQGPGSGRVKMPTDWQALFGDHGGRARFRRRFHRPTNLEPHERVLIVLEHPLGAAGLQLNGHELGAVGHGEDFGRFDVTRILLPMNELVVEIEFTPTQETRPGELWQVIAMEIQTD